MQGFYIKKKNVFFLAMFKKLKTVENETLLKYFIKYWKITALLGTGNGQQEQEEQEQL